MLYQLLSLAAAALVALPVFAQTSAGPVPSQVVQLIRSGAHADAARELSPKFATDFAQALLRQNKPQIAQIYLRSAGFRGFAPAQLDLARTLIDNCCKTHDPIEAVAWLEQITSLGDSAIAEAALELRQRVLKELSPEEQQFAAKRANDLRTRLKTSDASGWMGPFVCAARTGVDGSGTAVNACSYVCAQALGYPAMARRAEATGNTRLAFTLAADGTPAQVSVLKPSGTTREHRDLDRSADEFVRSCVFPSMYARIGGEFQVDIAWRLRE